MYGVGPTWNPWANTTSGHRPGSAGAHTSVVSVRLSAMVCPFDTVGRDVSTSGTVVSDIGYGGAGRLVVVVVAAVVVGARVVDGVVVVVVEVDGVVEVVTVNGAVVEGAVVDGTVAVRPRALVGLGSAWRAAG